MSGLSHPLLIGFRDPSLASRLVDGIRRDVERLGRPVILMEVCGTHTTAISRSGLRQALRGSVEMRSGPGCPVCVTSENDLDRMIALATIPGVTVLTYGDMVRVPGSIGTLEQARTAGADVRIVYSALDAVDTAEADPASRRHVFLGVGFETTAPGAALAIRRAAARKLANFSLYSAHKTLPGALRALLGPAAVNRKEARRERGDGGVLDGMILPGHVSTVLGRRAYDFLTSDYGLPAAVTGFEPLDILLGVRELVRQTLGEGCPRAANLYPRVVREEGNPRSRAVISEIFQPTDAVWRGLGTICGSGLSPRPEWAAFDAETTLGAAIDDYVKDARAGRSEEARRFDVARGRCRCGDVLRGALTPPECPLFGAVCRPEEPVGPCMVSSEGSCAAYYRYEPDARMTRGGRPGGGRPDGGRPDGRDGS